MLVTYVLIIFRYNDKYVKPSSAEKCEINGSCDTFMEGCFCTAGHILFNSYSDICVSSCGKDVSIAEYLFYICINIDTLVVSMNH